MSIRGRIIKKLVSIQMAGWSEGSIEAQRARQEKLSKYARPAAGVDCQPITVDGVPAEWITPPAPVSGVILYLHGGAFTLGSINVHREWIARLAGATRVRCLAIDYRLAPEDPFPAALEDVLTAYHWLLDQGFSASRLVIAGDSAGGGLALSALVKLRETGGELPAGAVMISPWIDLALHGASIQQNARLDPILEPSILADCARYYAGENALTTPLISPLYADLHDLPALLIQVGTDEILFDDAIRIADRARDSGVEVTLSVWDEMFHVFQLISFLAETKQALAQIAAFVLEQLAADTGPVQVDR